MPNEILKADIPVSMRGQRLDRVLAQLFPEYSRSCLKGWLVDGAITVTGEQWRPKDKVKGDEQVVVNVQPVVEQSDFSAEAIDLEVVYEDQSVIVINKPAGLVVHPATGNWSGTMLNGLLHHFPELEELPRAGIVHRLDKQTSGLMVVARNLKSQKVLVEALQARTVGREYLALVNGLIISGASIDQPIGRHPVERKSMAVVASGKEAITHYRLEQRLVDFTLLRVRLETGRTHQIRVHMAHINHPIVGDPVYGGRLKLPRAASDELVAQLKGFKRQALHAETLSIVHPESNEEMSWSRSVPEDYQDLLNVIAQHRDAD